MQAFFSALAMLALPSASLAAPLPVHVGGRVLGQNDGSLLFGWPGTYFEGRFEGTSVGLRFEAQAEHMRLLIDGGERAVFQSPGVVNLTIGGLPEGKHIVRLEKMTESQSGGGRFSEFTLASSGTPLPPQPRARRIEFIGDSYSVGYGNRSSKRECTADEVHDLTDTQRAFGPILAKRLNADYRVHAYSGFGVVRNYNGGSPELSLPSIYPRVKPDTPSELSRDGWAPDVIVINLGTNDFSTPLNATERWKSNLELRTSYRQRYVEFVGGLQQAHPRARFILMSSDQFIDDVREVARQARAAGVKHIRAVRFGDLDLMGCDWHPSSADHRKLADLLEKEVGAVASW